MDQPNFTADVKPRIVCAMCRHWKRGADEEPVGECKRFPPQMFVISDEVHTAFPVTSESQSCGEFVRK